VVATTDIEIVDSGVKQIESLNHHKITHEVYRSKWKQI